MAQKENFDEKTYYFKFLRICSLHEADVEAVDESDREANDKVFEIFIIFQSAHF